MPLDPRLWLVPAHLRRLPDDVEELYLDEDTPLNDVVELWEWKHDLVHHTPQGPTPNRDKVAAQLWSEVEHHMREQERLAQEAVPQEPLPPGPYENRLERSLLLALRTLSSS